MKGKKTLVVEDDVIIQMFISKVLRGAGFDVIAEARTSAQCIEAIEKELPDLILMDIGISGEVDGIATAQIINARWTIPIIFMTGNSDEATITRAETANPLDFIFKPIDESRLRNKLLALDTEMQK